MHRDKSSSSSAAIQATSQQTRFHLLDDTNSKEIDLHGVNISIGKQEILSDAHLKLSNGVHYVLIGRNGVGKSTLLRAIGDRIIPGLSAKLKILLLQQTYAEYGTNDEDADLTVLEYTVKSDTARTEAIRKVTLLKEALDNNADPAAAAKVVLQLKHETRLQELEEAMKMATLRSGARGMKARKELVALEEEVKVEKESDTFEDANIGEETNDAVNMLAELEASLEEMSASSAETRAESLLRGLGFTKKSIAQPLSALSGGWRMRTILAALLFQPCDLLLLDEPTNFLDMPSLLWLESHLQEVSTTLLLVTHDRTFADTIAEEVIVLRDKKLEPFSGNLSAYDAVRSENQQRLTKMKDAQDRQKAHMEQTIAGNIRAAKSTGDDKKLKQAASRQKKLNDRMGYQVGIRGGRFKLNRDRAGFHNSARAEILVPTDESAARMALPRVPPSELRFPGPLVSCENLTFSYIKQGPPPTATVILKEINFTIHMHDRLALVGLNGAGKSTLVSCLVNQPNPDGRVTGAIKQHPKARIGFFSQSAVDLLPPNVTALEYMSEKEDPLNGGEEQELRGALSSLGLSGRTVSELPFSKLSGGQKVRVALAKVLYPPPHLLILDEVTTHLDADSIVVLAEELREFEGAVLLVSHDRWFINKVIEEIDDDQEGDEDRDVGVNKIFMVGRGTVEELNGGVAEFEERVRKKIKMK
ncbi:hypothetical protein M422DRAFT_184807 [Sphaerobolus stellatus SS14]|uniref:ABC transporter domain-containing protein n=1 Tax=Sphaerobolus stellatus (strain SS14) TaxID=990650 RepID=A0A0C9USP4_SPHS4|nr:hypothetical protein M422DRAFT_184807 [Sphaerobolus stellatus SS14]